MSRALQGIWLSAAISANAACGERFDSGQGDGGRAGSGSTPASGGSGGATSGGAGSGGVAGSGGIVGVGGVIGLGGVPGLGGNTGGPFPATSVLDAFDREDGDVGPNWIGSRSDFVVESQRLADRVGAGNATFWQERFGPGQEVFATLSRFSLSASEINLILKAQEGTGCEFIEVMYQPDRQQVEVDYCIGGTWTAVGRASVVLTTGDTLGARISPAGQIEVFQNGARFLILDTAGFPHQAGGYIGVNSLDDSAAWDDFGGGNLNP